MSEQNGGERAMAEWNNQKSRHPPAARTGIRGVDDSGAIAFLSMLFTNVRRRSVVVVKLVHQTFESGLGLGNLVGRLSESGYRQNCKQPERSHIFSSFKLIELIDV